MLDQQKISMGLVRKGYALNGNDVEKVIQKLFPNSIFPLELWSKAHETYWRGFADSNHALYNMESPALPEIDLAAKYFHTDLCGMDVLSFFRKLSLNIRFNTLMKGFNFILEESYENIDSVFPEERNFLFDTLSRLDTVDIFEQYSPDSELFEEKILSVPISSYHFIANIFPDTMLVDKIAAIRLLDTFGYSLKQEVKGLSHRLVNSVLNASISKDSPHEQQDATRVSRSLWQGKTPEAIYAALREKGLSNEEIAHVLFYKRGFGEKRAIGRLLHDNKNLTDGTYDKHGDMLFKKAKDIKIIDEE